MGSLHAVSNPDEEPERRHPSPRTPQQREAFLENLALDTAERQMLDGTVSSQVLTHFLKAASERDKLERLKIQADIEMAEKKLELMESAKRVEELYEGAIAAMRAYQGVPPLELPEGDDDEEGYEESY